MLSGIETYFKNNSQNIEKVDGKYIFIKGKKFLDFSSNNFLGLKNDSRIKDAAKEAIDEYGIDIESNKLFSKHGDLYLNLRKKINNLKAQEDTILYNAGYNVSSGIIPNLLDDKDVIFSDSQNYIDIYQGIYKSNAHLIRYAHNDIENLKSKLSKYRHKFKKALLITDSIFFTDGSQAKLTEIIELKKLHDFILMVDDSNADGIYGEDGSGLTSKPHLSDDIDIILGDFSRNFGGLGEYVSGKHKYINILLKNSLSKSMLYKIIMSPLLSTISTIAFDLAIKETQRRETILRLSKKVRDEVQNLGFSIGESTTHIIPIILESSEQTIKLSKFLYKNGLIASTTIGKTTIKPRVKFYINALLDDEDIDILISSLRDFVETTSTVIKKNIENSQAILEIHESTEKVPDEIVEESSDENFVINDQIIMNTEKEVETTKPISVEEEIILENLRKKEIGISKEQKDVRAIPTVNPEKETSTLENEYDESDDLKKLKDDSMANADKMLDLLD